MDIDKIFEVRLMIAEPSGYPIIIDSAVNDDEQTAYRVEESKYFNSDSERLVIYNSDKSIDNWISAYGINKAAIRALKRIIANINPNALQSMKSASETMQFATLQAKKEFYQDLLSELEDNDSLGSRMGQCVQPIIGGGYV